NAIAFLALAEPPRGRSESRIARSSAFVGELNPSACLTLSLLVSRSPASTMATARRNELVQLTSTRVRASEVTRKPSICQFPSSSPTQCRLSTVAERPPDAWGASACTAPDHGPSDGRPHITAAESCEN